MVSYTAACAEKSSERITLPPPAGHFNPRVLLAIQVQGKPAQPATGHGVGSASDHEVVAATGQGIVAAGGHDVVAVLYVCQQQQHINSDSSIMYMSATALFGVVLSCSELFGPPFELFGATF